MSRILFLHGKNFSGALRSTIENYLNKANISPANCFFVTMHYKVPNFWVKKPKTKDSWMVVPEKKQAFYTALDDYVEKINPKIIAVYNDEATLLMLTGNKSISLCRGSVYKYKGIPVIILDDITKVKFVKEHSWLMLQDLSKLRRWYTDAKYTEPKFTYTVCRNVSDVAKAVEFLSKCIIETIDIETTGIVISCIGYTGVDSSGSVRSFVIPFVDTTKPGNCFWDSEEDEIQVWDLVRKIHSSPVVKILQGGGYDAAYFIRYNICTRNYFIDTANMFHSIWCETGKKLNYIASIMVDHCKYWKEDLKGDKNEKFPATAERLEIYWRYNALDCYYTLISAIRLVNFLTKPGMEWALNNYITEFSGEVGPALQMSMVGMACDKNRQKLKNIKWLHEYSKSLKELRIMCDEPRFNPNSPQQVASLIYDVLGANPIKRKGRQKKDTTRSADEKFLKIIKVQHPLFAKYIEKIWDTKKPANLSTNYGPGGYNDKGKSTGLWLYGDRFLYRYGAGGTETGRYNGTQHQYWIGRNPQNIPDKTVRDMFVADKGYVLLEIDYEQSDMWFVAHESEDPDMIRNITDDRDTHCVHTEFFFKQPYDKLVAAHKIKSDWTDHPITGLRQSAKQIGHGSNYRMQGFTLYMRMGHEAVVATAKAFNNDDDIINELRNVVNNSRLDTANSHMWGRNDLVALCDLLLQSYTQKLYKKLPDWFESSVQECAKNGNRATCAFGRTRLFFGNVLSDTAIQREISAYYGQGGTSGNINRTLLEAYYNSKLIDEGMLLLMQNHDSILVQFPIDKLNYFPEKFLTIMEQPCTIKGRTFTVPTDAKIGLSWGRGMQPWHKDITAEDILKFEEQWQEKNYGQMAA